MHPHNRAACSYKCLAANGAGLRSSEFALHVARRSRGPSGQAPASLVPGEAGEDGGQRKQQWKEAKRQQTAASQQRDQRANEQNSSDPPTSATASASSFSPSSPVHWRASPSSLAAPASTTVGRGRALPASSQAATTEQQRRQQQHPQRHQAQAGTTVLQIVLGVVSALTGAVILAFLLVCVAIYQIKPNSAGNQQGIGALLSMRRPSSLDTSRAAAAIQLQSMSTNDKQLMGLPQPLVLMPTNNGFLSMQPQQQQNVLFANSASSTTNGTGSTCSSSGFTSSAARPMPRVGVQHCVLAGDHIRGGEPAAYTRQQQQQIVQSATMATINSSTQSTIHCDPLTGAGANVRLLLAQNVATNHLSATLGRQLRPSVVEDEGWSVPTPQLAQFQPQQNGTFQLPNGTQNWSKLPEPQKYAVISDRAEAATDTEAIL